MAEPFARDARLAWLQDHANGEDGYTGPAPDEVTAACLRVLQAAGGWYYDPVLEPETVLAIVEAARG